MKHAKLKSLPQSYETILTNQTIDESGPGTIVRDFETCLTFIAETRFEVSKTNQLWPMTVLPDLNARMVHPITVNLKRPQHKSYPTLLGLYLLLRATRTVRVEMTGKASILRLNEPMCQVWNDLNPTEKWFSLFETWYLWANPEVIGERGGSWMLPFSQCARWYFEIPKTGLVPNYQRVGWSFGAFQPFQVAVLWLFGLLALEEQPPEAEKGWQLAKVRRTPLGDAVIGYADFHCRTTLNSEFLFGLEKLEDASGQRLSLQTVFQPLFPAWERTLVEPCPVGFRPGTYHFRVSLGRKVWRLLAVPGDLLLDDLAEGILAVFEFDNDHLYEFSFRDQYGQTIKIQHPACEESPATDTFRVGELPLEPGMTMVFLFDFGDCWEFDICLEAVFLPDPNLTEVTLLERKGKAPEQYPEWGDS
ncbi:MAG: plasmid pRiA4b ORF-3 family protein [Blastocatellia bacterium]|nr:plasmid pRiA4b ORF-3 family protein [Blastocatellia bacterium]